MVHIGVYLKKAFVVTGVMAVAESGSTTIYYDYHKQEMSA
jgi:hypothetical protein